MPVSTNLWQRLQDQAIAFTSLGFGTAPMGNLYRAIGDDEAAGMLESSWEGGVRYFDTAPLYGLGLSETRLNRFLRGKPRDSYVLSTKVGRLLKVCSPEERTGLGKWFEVPRRKEIYDYSYDGVMRSLEFSLERLGVDRADILYVHDLDIFTHGSREAAEARVESFFSDRGYDALVELRDSGVITAFGAGLNEWEFCELLARRGDFDLFLLAGRYTLLEQEALNSFLPLCEERGIGVVVGGPYNSGILATGPVPGAYYNYDPAPPEILDRVSRIEAACTAHDVRLIDAAFHFPLMHPAVVSVIPGGQSIEQARGNLAIAEAAIPPQLWAALKREGLMREDAPTG